MMDVKRELFRDHEDHELLLEQIARTLETSQKTAELRRCWLAFEENLFDHLDTEERFLFTVTAQAHRLEVEQLRAEHRRIRQAVQTFRVSVELNIPKKQGIDELRALLLAHRAHEEGSLHRWLEMDEGVMAQRGVLAIRARRERSSARMRVAVKMSD